MNKLYICGYLIFYFISGNLAIADLIVLYPLIMFPVQLLIPELSSNKIFCLSYIGVSFISFTASTATLIHISLDRFMAIVFPIKHLIDSKLMRIYYIGIAIIWITSLIIGFSVIWLNDIPSDNVLPCTNGRILSSELHVILSVTLLMLLLTSFPLYIAIGCKINHRTTLNRFKRSTLVRTKLMVVIYAGFIVCWLPLGIIEMLSFVDKTLTRDVFCVREYLVLLAYTNSGINWIIYGLANKKFRVAFSVMLCGKCKHNLQGPGLSSDSMGNALGPVQATNSIGNILGHVPSCRSNEREHNGTNCYTEH